jgi:ribosomal protein S27E
MVLKNIPMSNDITVKKSLALAGIIILIYSLISLDRWGFELNIVTEESYVMLLVGLILVYPLCKEIDASITSSGTGPREENKSGELGESESAKVIIKCPQCNIKMNVPNSPGVKVACPVCSTKFIHKEILVDKDSEKPLTLIDLLSKSIRPEIIVFGSLFLLIFGSLFSLTLYVFF